VSRPYRGISAQVRRDERRVRLQEAALELVGEGGVTPVSAEAVAARAGLTKRYFYESFSDRDALLDAVLDGFFADVHAEIVAALSGSRPGPAARAHTVARVLIDFLGRDPRRARLYVESPGLPVLRVRRERAFELFSRLLLDTFPPAVPAGPELERRRALAALIVVSGTTQAATTWLRGGLELSRDELVDGLAAVILSALEPHGGAL
jgi:AcrR family transcriptional regulator